MKRMRKSIIWMAAFMFCCGAVFAQKAERKNVREGNKLYETEKFTEAEIAYRKSLEVNPRPKELITWGTLCISRRNSLKLLSSTSC